MEDSDYKTKLIKVIKDEKGKRFFLFEAVNLLTSPEPGANLFSETLKNNAQTGNCLKVFM